MAYLIGRRLVYEGAMTYDDVYDNHAVEWWSSGGEPSLAEIQEVAAKEFPGVVTSELRVRSEGEFDLRKVVLYNINAPLSKL